MEKGKKGFDVISAAFMPNVKRLPPPEFHTFNVCSYANNCLN